MSSETTSFNLSDSNPDSSTIRNILSSQKDLDDASITALLSTVASVHKQSNLTNPGTSFSPSSLLVSSSSPPSSEHAQKIRALVIAANKTAVANACSSLLAGASSESDEYGDVGFWIGNSKNNLNESGLVEKLGFGSNTKLHKTTLPKLTSKEPFASALRDTLADASAYRIQQTSGNPDVALFILVGRLAGSDNAWAGLIGGGTMGDLE